MEKSDDISGAYSGKRQFAEEKFTLLLHLTESPVIILNTQLFSFAEVNRQAAALFQYRAEQMVTTPVHLFMNDPGRLRRAIRRKSRLIRGIEWIKRDGITFFADVYMAYFGVEGEATAILVFSRIVDEALAAREKAWRDSLVLDRARTESVFSMGEEYERGQLARELHGHLGPMMVAVKMGMEQLLNDKARHISRNKLQALLQQHIQTIRETRLMTSRLAERFMVYEDIKQAIKVLVDKFREYGALQIYSKIDFYPDEIPADVRHHMMQILEEGLTNIIRHAEASKVTLRIQQINNHLLLRLFDNGKGVDLPHIKRFGGLDTIQQRVALLQGQLQLDSAEGKYFMMECTCPLP